MEVVQNRVHPIVAFVDSLQKYLAISGFVIVIGRGRNLALGSVFVQGVAWTLLMLMDIRSLHAQSTLYLLRA